MPLVYPLTGAYFLNIILPWTGVSQTFTYNVPVVINRDAGGNIYSAQNGPALWYGTLNTIPTIGDVARKISVAMNSLKGPGRSFYIHDINRDGPTDDPRGTMLANRTLILNAIEGNSRIKISQPTGQSAAIGYPPELTLVPGDLIGLQWGSNPVRFSMHEVAQVLNGYGYLSNGCSNWIDIIPALFIGTVIGGPVRLVRPIIKAIPISVRGGDDDPEVKERRGGWTVNWRQTMG